MIGNHKKTKTLRLNTIHADKINIHGKDLEGCEPIHTSGQYSQYSNKDIKCRIGKAAAVLKILRPIWTSQEISVLLYACETRRTTKTSTQNFKHLSTNNLEIIKKNPNN